LDPSCSATGKATVFLFLPPGAATAGCQASSAAGSGAVAAGAPAPVGAGAILRRLQGEIYIPSIWNIENFEKLDITNNNGSCSLHHAFFLQKTYIYIYMYRLKRLWIILTDL
jgi:hypothetical protein